MLGEPMVVQAASARGRRTSRIWSMALFLAAPSWVVMVGVVEVKVVVVVTVSVFVIVLVSVAETTVVVVEVVEAVTVAVDSTTGVEVVVIVEVTGQGVYVFLKKELQSAEP